jgi:hypothetical protein
MAWEGWQARAALTAEKVAGQEPVATLHDDGHYTWQGPKPDGFNYAGWRMEVYAAPQPAHPTQAEPVKDAAQEQSGEAIYQARMVGNTAWSDVTGDKLEACAANPNYEVRRVYAAPQLQPAQSAEQDEPCTNCGMSVDPKCACERGRKRAASTQSTATQPAQTEPKP